MAPLLTRWQCVFIGSWVFRLPLPLNTATVLTSSICWINTLLGITYLCSWQMAVSKFIQRCNFAVSDSTSQIVHVCLKAIWAQLNSAAFPCKVSHCFFATVWLAFGKIIASVSLKIKIFFILLFKKLFVCFFGAVQTQHCNKIAAHWVSFFF